MRENRKNKFYYVGLSMMLPGMGQFALKRYLRGLLQVAGSIGAVFWLIAVVIMPIVELYRSDIMSSQELQAPQFFAVLRPILLFLGVSVWSIVDILVSLKK